MISKSIYSMFAKQNTQDQKDKLEHFSDEDNKKWDSLSIHIDTLFDNPSSNDIDTLRKILIQVQIIHLYNIQESNKNIVSASADAYTMLDNLNITNNSEINQNILAIVTKLVGTEQQEKVANSTTNSNIKSILKKLYTQIYQKNLQENFTIKSSDEANIPNIIKTASKYVYNDKPNYLFINETSNNIPNGIFDLESGTIVGITNEMTKIKTTDPAESVIIPDIVTTSTVPETTVAIGSAIPVPATTNYTIEKKSLVVIDSRYRYDYHNTSSNNYIFYLPPNIYKNVKQVKLEETYIKNTAYNINENNNQLRINIQVTDVKRPTDTIQNIIIPKGNYYQDKTDTDNNLDLQIKNLFGLYDEFKNISVVFNYKNNKYYFYQDYDYLLTENSHMYNILFNFGRRIQSLGGENNTFDSNITNRLITTDKADTFTKVNTSSNRQEVISSSDKEFVNNSLGQYIGFYPNKYSTHVSNFVSVNYFQNNTLTDSSGNNYNILQFKITNSETLFQKIYDLLVLAKSGMFIGFVLNNSLDSNKCKHAILKLEPNFCSNIITHRSNPTNLDLFGAPLAPVEFLIEIYLTKKLHQYPKYNNLIEPELINNTTPTLFSDTIILPVISDRPYDLENDNYMLLHLSLNNKKITRLASSEQAPTIINDAFTQFRTETDNKYFINSLHATPYLFNSGLGNVYSIGIQLYDKYNNFIDLNNSDHSFVLELTHTLPQLTT